MTGYRQPARVLSIALGMRQVGVTTITQVRYYDTYPAAGTMDVEGRTLHLGAHTTRACARSTSSMG
ncbi:MAG TPA: hypothetical protein VL017_08010 [Devosia sp.]|nr:hypothetical protein [Devosia sp.]